MLLIHPPVAKPSEPPVGIARLAGALRHHGISVRVLDMNLEGFHHFYSRDVIPSDKWSERALKRRELNLNILTGPDGYSNIDRYKNAVLDVNKLLKTVSQPYNQELSLANYKCNALSPVKSSDLIKAAEFPETSIYYSWFKKQFERLSETPGALDTVGFSLNYLNQALTTFAMIGYLKTNYRSTRIVIGGGLITSWMRKPGWKNPFEHLVDVMVCGEGEQALLNLYGIEPEQQWYQPDYSDFKNLRYLAPDFILPFCASSGCYWRKCTFCPERAEKNPYSPIPCHDAVEMLNQLTETCNPGMVHIVDNAVSPVFLKTLANSRFNTPWYAFTRVTPHLADPDFCKALKQSGCRMLKLGIESGDSAVLSEMNKGVTLSLVSKALNTLHRAGIKTYVYLLFGTPSETEAAARKTYDFTCEHTDMIGFLNLAIFNLPYFSSEYSALQTSDFYDGDLSLYKEFNHPHDWNRSNIRQFLEKEFKKHPDIADIIKNDPPVFNANHAAFF